MFTNLSTLVNFLILAEQKQAKGKTLSTPRKKPAGSGGDKSPPLKDIYNANKG